MRHVIRNVLIAFSFTACSAVWAATTVPFPIFVAGHAAKASEVNANFEALASAIDAQAAINTAQAAEIAALTSRVTKLDTPSAVTAADLVGTYAVHGLGFQVSRLAALSVDPIGYPPDGTTDPEIFSHQGTLQLLSNGTGTANMSLSSTTTVMPNPTRNEFVVSPVVTPSNLTSFTWTLTNGQLLISGLSFTIATGGRLLIQELFEVQKWGNHRLMVLVRTN